MTNLWKNFTNSVSQIIKPEKVSQQHDKVKQFMIEKNITMLRENDISSVDYIKSIDAMHNVSKYIEICCKAFGIWSIGKGYYDDKAFRDLMSNPDYNERNEFYGIILDNYRVDGFRLFREEYKDRNFPEVLYENFPQIIRTLQEFYNLLYAEEK